MDDISKDPVLDRLDRLTEMVTRRLDKIEERLRCLEQDNGEIINLLIAVKAGLEECSGELLIDAEDADTDDAPSLLH
ncbi:hypothetical protein [Azospirillum rugosum]|uniref:SlyX protein n=1 Tax=Azospirillum rugosum TaxID=416170 RepID=A0ABS4SUT6_9PROT|nr:hypothetical protein [Azospirillum rugosum]MBP2295717.1 hypothetical protein [Azospirillum rugosum]MDQ0526780.1 hypothetical protein [Azospirillum rugosum]